MVRLSGRLALFAVVGLVGGTSLAAEPAVGQGPGWTGLTHSKDMITARQELMEHIEILMEPIDLLQVKEARDVDRVHANAETISAMLLAVPHLFAPTTNRYDPKVQMPQTLALPTIWKDFDTFYRLAGAAASTAEAMASAQGAPQLKAASFKLRGSCDACHAIFLRRYEPPKVKDSDVNFDFDKALGRHK
jgi:cytochrome c556